MSNTIDLGELRLANHKAKVRLDGSVKLSVKASDKIRTNPTDLQLIKDLILSRIAWICRGPGLRLVLNILVDGQPWRDDDIRKIEEAICDAELWKQLHLHAAMPKVPNQDRGTTDLASGIITIELSHDRDLTQSSTSVRHKLSQGVPLADVKPPLSVNVVELSSVDLELRIIQSKRRSRKRQKSDQTEAADNDRSNPADAHGQALDQNAFPHLQAVDFDEDIFTPPGLRSVSFNSSSWVNSDDENFEQLECSQPEPVLTGSALLDVEAAGKKRSGRDIDGDGSQKVVNVIDSTLICQLVDTAIRVAISEQPAKVPAGIKVKQALAVGSLASVAPTLFNPGYLHAMARLSVFIPTISHALSQSMQNNARSQSLNTKLSQLTNMESDQTDDEASQSSDRTSSVEQHATALDSVSRHLWTYLQRRLHDPNGACKLKPFLFPNIKLIGEYCDNIEEMLIGEFIPQHTSEDRIWASNDDESEGAENCLFSLEGDRDDWEADLDLFDIEDEPPSYFDVDDGGLFL